VKILGFAHITFALPLREFPGQFICHQTYQELPNSTSKLELMRHKDSLHNLQLLEGNTEITYYESLVASDQKSEIQNSIQEHILNPRELIIENISHTVLQILNTLAPRSVFISQDSLRVKGIGTLSDIILTRSDLGLYFNEFLDEHGPVALAFYVDNLDQNLEEPFREMATEIEIHEPFLFRAGENSFKIQFVTIGGVNFEFLQREYESI